MLDDRNQVTANVVKRGDIFWINFGEGNVVGSEQAKDLRPAICIQNNIGNKFSPVIIVALITSKLSKKLLPTHIPISKECGLNSDSLILCEQIKSIDKQRIHGEIIGKASQSILDKLNKAIEISVAVGDYVEMTNEEKVAEVKAKAIKSIDTVLRELIRENESIRLIDKYTYKRLNRINELESYCKLNGLDYTRFYSILTDNRRVQSK